MLINSFESNFFKIQSSEIQIMADQKKRRAKEGQSDKLQPEDSDVDDLDFNNFKGIYFGDKHEKY